MTEDEAREQLKRVYVAYPSFMSDLKRSPETCNDTLRAWRMMLIHCDRDDVAAVVDEIVSGDREPYGRYEKPDAMPRNIRVEANARRSRRNEVRRQQEKYHDACNELRAKDPRLGRYWRTALRLGGGVRDKIITVVENNEMMAALRKYYLDGEPFPDWVHEELNERENSKRQGGLV